MYLTTKERISASALLLLTTNYYYYYYLRLILPEALGDALVMRDALGLLV